MVQRVIMPRGCPYYKYISRVVLIIFMYVLCNILIIK